MNSGILLKFFIAVPLFITAFADLAPADPAYPYPIDELQPDGTKITIQVRGDEFYGWTEDAGGYTVMTDPQTKEWVYARQADDGSLRPTSYKVGKTTPQTLGVSRGIKDRNYTQIRENRRAEMRPPGWEKRDWLKPEKTVSFNEQTESLSEDPANPVIKKPLVILVQFADTKFTTPNPQQSFQNLMTQPGYSGSGVSGATTVGSLKEFFSAASYGNYVVDAVVSPVITLDETSAWYVGSTRYEKVRSHLVPEALRKLEAAGFNFAQCATNGFLDSLTIVYAGRGQSSGGDTTTIWPHASYGTGNYTMFTAGGIRIRGYNCSNELRNVSGVNRMVGLGTIAHEVSHELFGLPDLYDTSTTSTHQGVGEFCLMSGGSHCGNGYTPPLWSPWCKKKVGVATIINMPDNADITILDSALNDGNIYKFKGPNFYTGTGGKEEYFLLENRNGGGFDTGIPRQSTAIGRGLLIWHIDESRSNNQSPQAERLMVGLEEANGQKALISSRRPTGVYFKASDNASYNFTSFTDTTTPNSISYTGQPAGKPITLISAPGNSMTFRVGNGSPSQITGTVTSISPSSAKRGGSVTLTINGTNLLSGSEAKLTRAGSSISAASVIYNSSSKLTASFTIPASAAVGSWDLTVSSSGYTSSIVKTGIFSVQGNMSVSALSKTFGFNGTTLELRITGTDYENGAGVKLVKGGTVINGIVRSFTGTTSITAEFPLASIPHNTKLNLTVTNPSGDSVTSPDAVTVYGVPEISSFAPPSEKVSDNIVITVNGANFADGLTKLILRKVSSEETITPSILSITETAIEASFSADESMTGSWEVCAAAYENGPEYSAPRYFIITTANETITHNLPAYKGAVISFTVRSVNGTENTGTLTILERTFSEDVTVSVKQHKDFAEARSHIADLAHSNIGVHIDAQGKSPLRTMELKVPYTDDDISGMSESSLVIARYNEERGTWVPLKTSINKTNKTATVNLDHLSVFSIMAIAKTDNLNSIKYYPNPLRPSKGANYSRMHFTNLPEGAVIKIYTLLGQTVRELKADGNGIALWDGKNENGDSAASGVYIAYIEDKDGNKKKIKIAVER